MTKIRHEFDIGGEAVSQEISPLLWHDLEGILRNKWGVTTNEILE